MDRPVPKTVEVSEFKRRQSAYIREAEAGGILLLTKHSRLCAAVVPPSVARAYVLRDPAGFAKELFREAERREASRRQSRSSQSAS